MNGNRWTQKTTNWKLRLQETVRKLAQEWSRDKGRVCQGRGAILDDAARASMGVWKMDKETAASSAFQKGTGQRAGLSEKRLPDG